MSLDNLPVEWSVSQLTKMIASEGLISDGDWIESKDQDEKGDIRLIQLADIGDGDFRDKSNRYMNQDAFDRLNCVELKANDVLIARMPDPLGRACIFPKLTYKCVTVVDVCLIRTGEHSAISPKLLKYWINSTQIRNLIALNATGTTRKRITRKKLESFDFPVPPLAEQQEIVRQLDVMLAQVEHIKARLDAIPAILKKFRQSVLADAVSGKLTEEWRSNKKLEKAFAEVQELHNFKGKLLNDLPGSWQWVRFDSVANIASNLKDPLLTPNAIHLAPNHIESKTGKVIEISTIAQDNVTSAKHEFVKGQIVYSKIRPYLAKVVIADFDGLCSADMYPIDSKIHTEYLYYWMLTAQFTDWASNAESRSVLPKINQKDLSVIPVPHPPMEEQKEIASKIKEYYQHVDNILAIITVAQKRVNLLTQSILAKAFSGELTAEWREQHQELITGVNSAEALLAKIQAEREASKPVKKTRVKKEV